MCKTIPRSGHINFYPRSPCGERHLDTVSALAPEEFLSTLSLRRATERLNNHIKTYRNFYPRSPCGERPSSPRATTPAVNFYPRSPCGERQPPMTAPPRPRTFLSTLSLRRATLRAYATSYVKKISIHALLAESDVIFSSPFALLWYFYPRSPCGERPRP